MAKRRVYELARELNMTNRELLDKLEEYRIEVKNHMSSLEEHDIAKIKDSLFGRKEEADIEDTRVRPNIIRRRRKPRTEDVSADETPAVAPEEAPETEKAPSDPSPDETPAPPAPEEEVVKAKKTKVKEKPGKDQPAEIIEPAAVEPEGDEEKQVATELEKTVEPETTQKAVDIDEETLKAAVDEAEADVQPDAMPDKKPGKEEKAVEEADGPAAERPVDRPGQEEATGKADEPEPVQKTPADKPAKPKKTKKKPKGAPARIIRLPEKDLTEETPVSKPVAAKAGKKPESALRGDPAPIEKAEKKKIDPVPGKKEAEETRKAKKKKTEPADFLEDKTEKAVKGKRPIPFKRKEVIEGDALYDQRFGRGRKGRKKGKAARPAADKTQITIPKAIKRRIKIDDTIVLADLAKRMGIKGSELIRKLMGMDIMVTINQTIDFDTATLLASEFEFEVERASFEEDAIIKTEADSPEQLQSRPPVVTIMGHVDHGKTSLLDVIRHAKVADSEAGGITQHIGAYHVPHENGDIVFLDTPGHEAFTAMRGRGAQVTDIVILVVAADDGVMPQTIEAIDHSKAAGVPIIVAINKIDKPGAEPDRIKRELSEKGLVPEDWGGDTIFVEVSAKEQIGIDELLEMIILQAEVLELRANPNKRARGYVIESKLETGRGPVATVLVSEGALHTGDAVVSGVYYGKIRAMFDDKGNPIKEAGPSFPVEIIGLSGVPMAGDELIVVADEKDAKNVSEHRMQKQRSLDLAKTSRMSLDKLYEQMLEGEVKDLNLIIKADVQGSIEALKDSLTQLSTDEVKINVIHSATGTIHESDISLAAVSNAIILGFNVRPTGKVAQMAEEESVNIRYYNIIYDAIKEIKDAMVGLMASTYEERVIGRAEVRQVFMVPSIGAIAGCMVIDGKIQRNQSVRIVRDGIIIHDGKIASLRRFKDDVREVLHNYECGIGIEKFNDIKVGDIIECYYLEEVKPFLE